MKNKLLLLHGALGSREQFEPWKRILADSFEVFDFNFSGHGGNQIDGPFSIDQFVQDSMAFIQEHNLGSPSIFGYSMGGYVALKLAHDFPGSVNRIITLGTKFRWDPESAAKEVRMMNPEIIEQKIPKFAATLRERHYPEDWKKLMTYTATMMTALGNGQAMTANTYSNIKTPALICIGTDDHMVTRVESEETAGYLANGELMILEDFKHPFETVDLQVLTSLCIDFFNRDNKNPF